jgi:hypothetical protein
MSGSNSSAPDSSAKPEGPGDGLSFTVHSQPDPARALPQRTLSGRLKMLLVVLVCAAPVVASYFTYYVIRPEARTNYSEFIDPQRPLPATLPLQSIEGQAVAPESLKGQWLLVVVGGAACDTRCEKLLLIQRQVREALGREKDRIDKVWLISDSAAVRPETLQAVRAGVPVTALRVPPEALAAWLQPAAGQQLADHLYIVDPQGHWMMRTPTPLDASRFKRDLDKLMRASSSWDRAGR